MVRVAFVGAGGISRRHMERIAMVEGAAVVAVCDLQEDRARMSAATHGVPWFTDWRRMLEDAPCDGLYIAVPPHAHEGQEQTAAAKGIALMVEKPISNQLATALEVEASIAKSGVPNAVGYHWRYFRSVDHAREALRPSTVALVKGYWCGSFPGVAWWRRRDQSGGQFLEQTTHLVDLARYLVGEIVEVSAVFTNSTKRDVDNFTIWDAGVVATRFEGGQAGAFINTCALPMQHYAGLHLLGSEGVMELDGASLKTYLSHESREYKPGDDAYQTLAQAFVDAIRGNRQAIRSGYADAIKTLRVTLAATQAAETGSCVEILESVCSI